MAYLDTYSGTLTSSTAAHLLRRATFGPTNQEIADFTGKTAAEAVDLLIANSSFRATPPPPVEMDSTRADAGQPFFGKPFETERNPPYYNYVRYWWVGLMTEQLGRPSVLEKLTAFWQNHFVVTYGAVQDYRFMDRYLRLLRSNALGNFRNLVIEVAKDPGMLVFQNGNENTKEQPNENFARELQELFTVGQKDFYGNYNYTEGDVKTAAQVLTGWQVTNRFKEQSTSIGMSFTPARHDTSNKIFSVKYNNTEIVGRSSATGGEEELAELTEMLLRHPECPKFICRKLYRWYVNTNVTQEIEDQIIVPLAAFFSSAANNYKIEPVLRKLLSSNVFFDSKNIGAIIKSPAELMIGAVRIFDQKVPDLTTDYAAFQKMMNYLSYGMSALQLNLLNQPSVFGSPAYYQTGFSKNWINESMLGLRGSRTDSLVYPYLEIKPGYILGVDILSRLRNIQPNFSDVAASPAITCEQVLAELSKNLFALELSQSQKDFLIDSIMMMKSSPRSTWIREWDAYRATPDNVSRQNAILWRCRALLKYMLRMAEYQVF
ncbi:DUF1800 domain-containing protein [Dyadobacter fanqingshengii]|uniref:DUF1800 domain-containing protein n=1 Tax=Dyadobacter fanqingshengii TaxID=2906443 RepID=A0A9X1PCN1_9BACT|nr:DUF1800 family protein [Dyadobacter fanqingshengii]MCF0042521.1 DUF1800 domain-containing protein [Dyadobacter fanqingshengii]USJ36251.1 DUF1800 domain-containing protein [Dyadobacter fanqingshengii]